MKLNLKISALLLSSVIMLNGQNQPATSGQPEPIRKKCGTEAPSAEWDAWFNKKVETYKQDMATGKARPTTVTIPVIIHVIHGGSNVGTFPNLSNAQLISQIKVLNADFAGKGFNSQNLAATGFSTVGAANTNITFCLAQFDPSGNPLSEPGIDRVNYVTNGWTNPASQASFNGFKTLMDATIKPNTIWDPTQYFNIWVSDVHPQTYLLGYATFPGGTALGGLPGNFGGASDDGIWIWAKSFGNVGTLDFLYNKGRTAVHETGHWLGLRHIGGDASNSAGDCNATDYCNDTPPQKGGYGSGTNGQNYGSPAYPLHAFVCGSPEGDMFMNFMDYTEDAALYMFTPDQSVRMQTALAGGYFRDQLSVSSATQCLGLPSVELTADVVGCTGEGLSMVSSSTGTSSTTTYTWTSDPAGGVNFSPSNSVSNPAISFNFPGTYTLTAVVSNSIGITSTSTELNIAGCVGITKNSSASMLSVVPNPASGLVRIYTTMKGSELRITIYNSLGEKVMERLTTGSTNGYELPVYELKNGIYLLSIDNGTEKAVEQLVIVQ